MPEGLTSTTFPLELSEPKIDDGLLVTTRLILVLLAFGCTNRVLLPEGMLKLCQLMAELLVPGAFCVVITMLLPCADRLACPAITWAPVGLARTA